MASLVLESKQGSTTIAIKAELPTKALVLPSELKFDPCIVGKKYSKTFAVKNNGQTAAKYSWNVASPFKITPTEGVVSPEGIIHFTLEGTFLKITSVRTRAFWYFDKGRSDCKRSN